MLNALLRGRDPAGRQRRTAATIDRLIGDAIMATFNRRGDQPDHARARRAAALALQAADRGRGGRAPGLAAVPRRRQQREVVGQRCWAPVAAAPTRSSATPSTSPSRLEGKAPVGGVAIGAGTRALLPGAHRAARRAGAEGQGRAGRGLRLAHPGRLRARWAPSVGVEGAGRGQLGQRVDHHREHDEATAQPCCPAAQARRRSPEHQHLGHRPHDRSTARRLG